MESATDLFIALCDYAKEHFCLVTSVITAKHFENYPKVTDPNSKCTNLHTLLTHSKDRCASDTRPKTNSKNLKLKVGRNGHLGFFQRYT